MEGKDDINVEILMTGHRHYKASAALWTNILSAVSYLLTRLIFIVRPEEASVETLSGSSAQEQQYNFIFCFQSHTVPIISPLVATVEKQNNPNLPFSKEHLIPYQYVWLDKICKT